MRHVQSERNHGAGSFLAVLGLSILFLGGISRGDAEWITEQFPVSHVTLGNHNFAVENTGTLWCFITHLDPYFFSTVILTSSEGPWLTSTGKSLGSVYFDFFRYDRRIVFEQDGKPHALSPEGIYMTHGELGSNGWEWERVTNGNNAHWGLAIDPSDNIHVASIHMFSNQVLYGKRINGTWAFESFGNFSPSFIQPFLSLDTDTDGVPFLAILPKHSDPVQIYTKINSAWVETKQFPGSWGEPKLRIDANNVKHLVMASTSPVMSARYISWGPDGSIQKDHTFPLSGLSGYSPPPTELALDEDNHAHLVVGSAYIDPAGTVTYLPKNYTGVRMGLIKKKFPIFWGIPPAETSGLPTFLELTAFLPRPTSVQWVERTTHSLTWTMPPLFGSALKYELINVLDPTDVSGPLDPNATSYTKSGLAPNQPQELITRAQFPGMSPLDSSPGPKIYTLAAPPGNVQATRLSGNGVGLSWTSSGNSAGTLYRVRLVGPEGAGITQETTNQSTQFSFLDPAHPYALTVAAVNGDGLEAFTSTLTHVSRDRAGAHFSFDLTGGLGLDVSVQGTSTGPELVFPVAQAITFPTASLAFGKATPTGVGVDIPSTQPVSAGQTVRLSLHYPPALLTDPAPLILARYDADRAQWIPLITQADTATRTLTAHTRALGLFQVMVRETPPTEVNGARVYPNPFRPSLHSTLGIQEVPTGTRVRVFTEGGRLVRGFTLDERSAGWDGRDGDGTIVHSGVYVIRLDLNGTTKRVRIVVEQ